MKRLPGSMLLVVLSGCASHSPAASAPAATPPAGTAIKSIPLPGAASDGKVMMDFLAYDREHRRVWVPAGNTGRVDVIDVSNDHLTEVSGFPTAEVERNNVK